ncbi:unnamed protein product [Sympodiomycopsis kandeliae]
MAPRKEIPHFQNYPKILEALSESDKAMDDPGLEVVDLPLSKWPGEQDLLWCRWTKLPASHKTGIPANAVTQEFCILMADVQVLKMAWLLKHGVTTQQHLMDLHGDRITYDVAERVWCHCSAAFGVAPREELQRFRGAEPVERAKMVVEEALETASIHDEHIRSSTKKFRKFLFVPEHSTVVELLESLAEPPKEETMLCVPLPKIPWNSHWQPSGCDPSTSAR